LRCVAHCFILLSDRRPFPETQKPKASRALLTPLTFYGLLSAVSVGE
jgi:hypothetical protein